MDVIELLKVERVKLIKQIEELKAEKLSWVEEVDNKIEYAQSKINAINDALFVVQHYLYNHREDEAEVVCPSCGGIGTLGKFDIETNTSEIVECITCKGKGYILKSEDVK